MEIFPEINVLHQIIEMIWKNIQKATLSVKKHGLCITVCIGF